MQKNHTSSKSVQGSAPALIQFATKVPDSLAGGCSARRPILSQRPNTGGVQPPDITTLSCTVSIRQDCNMKRKNYDGNAIMIELQPAQPDHINIPENDRPVNQIRPDF